MVSKSTRPLFIIFMALLFTGCSFVVQTGRKSDVETIKQLSQRLQELDNAKKILDEKLKAEIDANEVKLKMMEKGLVITFIADILFDPGKSAIKPEALSILDKVAAVLNENVRDYKIGIEGHTDDQPIKVSNWKSNWELSTARSLSVLHYLVDEKSIDPERLSVIGYSQYQPVSDNSTKEGKRSNRRVEIVVYPKVTKVKDAAEEKTEAAPVVNDRYLK